MICHRPFLDPSSSFVHFSDSNLSLPLSTMLLLLPSSPLQSLPPITPFTNLALVAATSNAVSTQLAAHTANHPSYFKMIYTTIEALKEKNGPSKRTTVKYIEQVYPNLPLTHPTMLTYNLQL